MLWFEMTDKMLRRIYRTGLRHHLDKWSLDSGAEGSLSRLASLAGCGYVEIYDGRYVYKKPEPPKDRAVEPAARAALLALLRLQARKPLYATTITLSGLLQRQRWRHCLKNDADTYAFAELLIRFYETEVRSLGDAFYQLHQGVLADLEKAGWLTPEQTDAASGRAMAETLFGRAWCALMLGDIVDGALIVEVMMATRPPFLPGLPPTRTASPAVELPAMEFGA